MIEKRAEYQLIDIQWLNKPDFRNSPIDVFKDQGVEVDIDIYQDTIQKIASAAKKSSDKSGDAADAPTFDLESEIQLHPDSLFIKCFAIKADETNDNGDYFPNEELRSATSTFIGVPLFTNHANSDINEARGKVVHSWWDEEKNGIMIIGRVDASAYPQLARGIKEEYVVGTSMGCQVQYSVCSVCHNYAETPDDYCGCIRERKTRQVTSRNQQCKYHEAGVDDECPLCQCKKGQTKKYSVNTKVFEYNYGIKFIENSFVVNPACHNCGVTEVIDPSKFLATAIEKIMPQLLKAASERKIFCTDSQCIKVAGQKELDSLTQALDLVSSVSQSMLQQKEQLDLEFLSDLVAVLADLQTVVDELTEQGYGRLQSPDDMQAGETNESIKSQPGQPDGDVTHAVQPVNPTPGGGSKVHTGPAGQVGTATGPLAKRKRLNLEKLADNIIRNCKLLNLPELYIPRKVTQPVKLAFKKPQKLIKIPFQPLARKD